MLFINSIYLAKSVEGLALGAKALGSYVASVVHHAHGLVTLVAWNSNMLIFNDVLFNYSLPCRLAFGLFHGVSVNFCLRDETTIPWNMCSDLLSSK